MFRDAELTTSVVTKPVLFGSEYPVGMEEWTPKLQGVNHGWHCCPESTELAQLLAGETDPPHPCARVRQWVWYSASHQGLPWEVPCRWGQGVTARPSPGSETTSRALRAKLCPWQEHSLLVLPPEHSSSSRLGQIVCNQATKGRKSKVLSNSSS